MNEPLYLAAGGAAVLLGGLGFMVARRRRNQTTASRKTKVPSKSPRHSLQAAATAAAVGARASSCTGEHACARASARSYQAQTRP